MRLLRQPLQILVVLSTLMLLSIDASAGKPYGPAGLGANLHRRFKVRHGMQKNTAFYRTPSQRGTSGLGFLNHSRSTSSDNFRNSPRPVTPLTPGVPGFRYIPPKSGYCNPYQIEATSVGSEIDLSLSNTVPRTATNSEDPVRPAPTDAQLDEAVEFAKAAFRNGDYRDAEKAIGAVIEALKRPDSELLQLHSLILFAQGDFHQAAASAHAALRSGSGWNWLAVRSHYSTVDVYTAQLRACEAASRRDPDTPYLRFLLGYHYLACGHSDSARRQFHQALELEPRDDLTSQLLAVVESP